MSSSDPIGENARPNAAYSDKAKTLSNESASITRRTLLSVAAGLVALHPATAAQRLLAPQTAAQGDSPYREPGALAQSRLKPDVVALMTGATRFSAMRRRELSGNLTGDLSNTSTSVASTRFPFAMPGMGAPRPDQAQMARRLADLLLRDEIWTREGSLDNKFRPDFVFTFADTFPGIVVSVCPNTHEIRLDWVNEASHAARTNYLAFDPIGSEMMAFTKDAFPGDAVVQALTFAPQSKSSPPALTRPAQISSATWAKITALKPGMTRADVLPFFETEGGLSNRLQRSYLLKGSGTEGKFVKINVAFAPASFPLIWRDGKGYLQNVEDTPTAARGREMPDDIITAVSPLYWGHMVAD